jgi:tetratricopeptide (TPR) repeat protein
MNQPVPIPTAGVSLAVGVSQVESEVMRIRALLKERRFDEAVKTASMLAGTLPKNRDALYLLALGQRQQRQLSEALETLQRLERHHPRYSLLYEERGLCYVAMKDAPNAIAAFGRAVELNPALPASFEMLAGLHRLTGDTENAERAATEAAKLRALPPAVVDATGLFAEGDIIGAERIIRAFLLRHGDHIEAMRLLARIGVTLGVLDDAEILLAAVLRRVSDYVAARHDYACVLLERHKHAEARKQLETLLSRDPDSRVYRTLYASTTVGLGRHEEAIALYRGLIAETPAGASELAELHLSVAHALKTLGRAEEAIEAYRAAIAARPDFGDAYWSLANLKTFRFTDEEVARALDFEARPETASADRYNLCFALGKAFEDRADFEKSWRYYERGNALKRQESRYRPDVIERNTANQKKYCDAAFFRERAGYGHLSDEPIFIVGLPRSGSTLIEQILASHSEVEGTQELADIPRIVLDLQGRDPDIDNPRYPGILIDQAPEIFVTLAEKYLRDTQVYRSGRPRFIDKMPNNFRHIGLIHLMFPNAKIIDARREPMACCLGNLKQLFAQGQEFAYSIDDIARYYRTYLDLMEHWDSVLPRRVLRVWHEDVVADLEGNVRRILDYCGLGFEPGCVEYYKTERSIRTASSEQVRRPIFREGLDHWRHFEPWLDPLRDALGDAVERYRSRGFGQ